MKCYFSLTRIDARPQYINMFKVALQTLRENTTLHAVVLYDGNENDETYKVAKQYGADIIIHEFSKKEELRQTYASELLQKPFNFPALVGTFLRFEIPFVEKNDDYVLYADIDCLFTGDIKLSDFGKLPSVLAAAPESDKNDNSYFNAGVMLLNVNEFRKVSKYVYKMLDNNQPTTGGLFDQGYLNQIMNNTQDELPLIYNWKPYWGKNDDAKIIHYHGMKPTGDIASSGFNMNNSFFINVVLKQDNGFSGYVYYTDLFIKELGQNYDLWRAEHYGYLLKIIGDNCKTHTPICSGQKHHSFWWHLRHMKF